MLSDLSIGLRAIICQRLVRNRDGELQPAVEILLNTSLIAELIKNGEFAQIKEAMEQSLYPGSQTFEQALCRLYLDGVITLRRGDDRAPTRRPTSPGRSTRAARRRGSPRMETEDGKEARRAGRRFRAMSINTDLLDRTH